MAYQLEVRDLEVKNQNVLFLASQISNFHMVGIAQSVKASDCGPEDRGFDSHYPPHFLSVRG